MNKKIKKCRGFIIPQYRTKKETINSLTNPAADAINRIQVDGPLYTYKIYEEVESVCADCKRKDCDSQYEVL